MIILQVSPEFGPGTGVGGVVSALEQQWLATGHDVRRFGPDEAGCARLAEPLPGLPGRLRLVARVIWFSTVGTRRARRVIRGLPPNAVTICHNDALVGDVYVNHGVLQKAMRARGHYFWRMIRNPLHIFTAIRDRIRYTKDIHRVVVNLTLDDDTALRQVYPGIAPRTVVIGNGVDIDRFRQPTSSERKAARTRLGLNDEHFVIIFIGNEFERKGLFSLIQAMVSSPRHHKLLVVGGTPDMIDRLLAVARVHGVEERVHTVGQQDDPRPFLWAADILAQPSAYESYGLVVTEALATGIPVVSTPVGIAPDIIVSGINGALTDGTPEDLANILSHMDNADLHAMGLAARHSALDQSWTHVSRRYLDLFTGLQDRRSALE